MHELKKLRDQCVKARADCAEYLVSNGFHSIDDARFMTGQAQTFAQVIYWIDDLTKKDSSEGQEEMF